MALITVDDAPSESHEANVLRKLIQTADFVAWNNHGEARELTLDDITIQLTMDEFAAIQQILEEG